MAGVQRISIFPLAGAVLFPGAYLPLHIFEPRYRALVGEALVRDRMIGMIQPRTGGAVPALYSVGCLGKISEFEALPDGRYNIILQGLARFRVVKELDVTTPFRKVEAEMFDEADDEEALSSVLRAALEQEAHGLADRMGVEVDWDAIGRLDDATFVHLIGQMAPFEPASKQAMLEAPTLADRAEQAVQIMQFYGRAGGGTGDYRPTMQ